MPTPIYYPPLDNALQKTLDSDLSTGVTASLTLNNTNRIQNKPGVIVIDRIDSTGTLKNAADREYISYTGISGSTLTGLTRGLGGSTDQDHATGAVVEFVPDITIFEAMAEALATVVDTSDVTAVNTANVVTPTGTQTLTNKTLTTPTIDTISNTRVNPRTTTETSSATPTINTDNTDIHTITALATDITSFTTNLSGTPVNGQKLIIRILDDGTSRSITWGASFAARGVDLPTATTISKYLYVGFIYNSTASVWDCIASAEEA